MSLDQLILSYHANTHTHARMHARTHTHIHTHSLFRYRPTNILKHVMRRLLFVVPADPNRLTGKKQTMKTDTYKN